MPQSEGKGLSCTAAAAAGPEASTIGQSHGRREYAGHASRRGHSSAPEDLHAADLEAQLGLRCGRILRPATIIEQPS